MSFRTNLQCMLSGSLPRISRYGGSADPQAKYIVMVEPCCVLVSGLDELASAVARMLLLEGHDANTGFAIGTIARSSTFAVLGEIG